VLSELGALRAVVDPDPDAARRAAAAQSVPAVTFDELLADEDVQAVVVAAPARLHYDLAAAALAAGKHVLVEKPLALRVADARDLARRAESADRVLMVGHLMQYHPAFRRLVDLVIEGQLGRLQYVYSHRLNLGRVRREEDILWSFAPHDISMILALVGAQPSRVTAHGSCFLQGRIADVTVTHMAFPGGQQAHVFVSWLHPYKEQRLVVVGDRGMAVLDDGEPWDRKLCLFRHSLRWEGGMPSPVKAEAEPVRLVEAEPLREECLHFLQCVESGGAPLTDAAEGIRVLEVLETAALSLSHESDGRRRLEPESSVGPDVFAHESSYLDPDVEVGAGTRIWHFSHIMSGSRIGRDCTIGQNVMVGRNVTIGNRCKIQNNVSVYEGVELADGVFCGPSCVFTNVPTPRAEVDRHGEFVPTRVGEGASIGANATILCGNEIGRYALIGAGAVVTSDVPPFALMVGVPARRVGWVSRAGEVLGSDLVCPRTGTRYAETDGQLKEI